MTHDGIYTPVAAALIELRRRRKDSRLVEKIHKALVDDIPRYLLENECFVLSRHIATPNNEALYVLKQAEQYGAMAIFSQDPKDKFTSVNNLKRRLARPELYQPRADAGRGPFRKLDLVDVATAENLFLEDVFTREGLPLAGVHNALFARLAGRKFRIGDDRDWIDRNHRGRMRELYTRYLSLFLAHAVLFEEFETPSDQYVKTSVILPLISECEARFGVRPIIVRPHDEASGSNERYYLAHAEDLFPLAAFRPSSIVLHAAA